MQIHPEQENDLAEQTQPQQRVFQHLKIHEIPELEHQLTLYENFENQVVTAIDTALNSVSPTELIHDRQSKLLDISIPVQPDLDINAINLLSWAYEALPLIGTNKKANFIPMLSNSRTAIFGTAIRIEGSDFLVESKRRKKIAKLAVHYCQNNYPDYLQPFLDLSLSADTQLLTDGNNSVVHLRLRAHLSLNATTVRADDSSPFFIHDRGMPTIHVDEKGEITFDIKPITCLLHSTAMSDQMGKLYSHFKAQEIGVNTKGSLETISDFQSIAEELEKSDVLATTKDRWLNSFTLPDAAISLLIKTENEDGKVSYSFYSVNFYPGDGRSTIVEPMPFGYKCVFTPVISLKQKSSDRDDNLLESIWNGTVKKYGGEPPKNNTIILGPRNSGIYYKDAIEDILWMTIH